MAADRCDGLLDLGPKLTLRCVDQALSRVREADELASLIVARLLNEQQPSICELSCDSRGAGLRYPDRVCQLTDRYWPQSIDGGECWKLARLNGYVEFVDDALHIRLQTLADPFEAAAQAEETHFANDVCDHQCRMPSSLHKHLYNHACISASGQCAQATGKTVLRLTAGENANRRQPSLPRKTSFHVAQHVRPSLPGHHLGRKPRAGSRLCSRWHAAGHPLHACRYPGRARPAPA